MSAPRIPSNLKYWLKKGKQGKQVVIYTHDDCDGIFSAIVMKNYLISRGFEIVGYCTLNYQDSWSAIHIDTNYINISVDFADDNIMLDSYVDHHGLPALNINKKYSAKKRTFSCYEMLCLQLGVPVDNLILDVINCIDSAQYAQFGIDFSFILKNYKEMLNSISDIKDKTKSRLCFSATVNQMIKRNDYKTLIEVIHNTKSLSIYAIFQQLKYYHGYNNITSFIDDHANRISMMYKKTQAGQTSRKVFRSSKSFFDNYRDKLIKGYFIIGQLAVIPTGTWCNPIRGRSIIDEDYKKGVIDPKHKIKYILLQYGNTLQVCSYEHKIETKSRTGKRIWDLGKYMNELVAYFIETKKFQYFDINTTDSNTDCFELTGQIKTNGGGHLDIGTISGITGRVEIRGRYHNVKFLDIFKNRIISDLSGVRWNLDNKWIYEKDIEQERLVKLLIKNNIINETDRAKYLDMPIRLIKKLLDTKGIIYSQIKDIEINKRMLYICDLNTSQKL